VDSDRLPYVLLVAIVVAYVAIGVLYAALIPTWQVPDEPAHYNYVRALAEGKGLPVMEMGDYDQEYLGLLTSRDFPPELSVDSLEYADYHPPLYYVLATPVYLLFDGAVLPLRLLSVLFGAALLLVAFKTVRVLFPGRHELALMVAGLIAFIPQHVAMTAGVNNDALTELIIGSALWALVVYMGGDRGRPWVVGLLLAAALLTKVSAYVLVVVAVVGVAIRWRRERQSWRWAAAQLAWMLVPALLLSAPWFVRNGFTYGWSDLLGRARHDAVVVGQPLSSDWLAKYGWSGLLSRFARTTFQSFWAQLGWMEVVLPARIYQALALLSIVLAAGFLWWLFDRRRAPLTSFQRDAVTLLGVSSALTLLIYLGYNLTFVQHQGRYLFPALIPLGVATALGLGQLTGLLPRQARVWAALAPFAALAALDVYCLFKSVPFLR
jgi:4-amino-4-deoxy-L-arabinose transferase-like glycosyltransferase